MCCSYLLARLMQGYSVIVQTERGGPGDGLKGLLSCPVWY